MREMQPNSMSGPEQQCLVWLEGARARAKHSINLGCGESRIDSSINCDMYGKNIDIRLDATVLPFADNSIDMIEAHQLLEHFGYRETENVLLEWKRCLKNQGLLVISVPDCGVMCAIAISDRTKAIPPKERWRALSMFFYGTQENREQYHKAGFIPEQLGEILMDMEFKIQDIWRGFPDRPTPAFCIIANKEEVQ